MSESNELTAASATLEAKVAESRPLDTSVLNNCLLYTSPSPRDRG